MKISNYLQDWINFNNIINTNNIFKNDIDEILKVLDIYKKSFDIRFFLFNNKNNIIKKKDLDNIVFEDIIFIDNDYIERYFKEHIELVNKNKEYIITEFKNIIVSIIPIFLDNFEKSSIIILDNSKGNIKLENIKEICSKIGYKDEKYIKYFNEMKEYSKKEFENIIKIFWSWLNIFYESKKNNKILNMQKLLSTSLNDILNNISFEDIVNKIFKTYINIVNIDNISIFIKKYNKLKEFEFFQTSINDVLLNIEEIKERFKIYNYNIYEFSENEVLYLKKYDVNVKKIDIFLNEDLMGYIILIKNKEDTIFKDEDIIFLDNLGKILLKYYLFKNENLDPSKTIDIFYTLMDNIDVSIHVVDCETGKILYCNKHFIKQFNIEENIKSKSIFVQDIYSYDSRKTGEFYDNNLDRWFYNNTKIERWIDNREVIINIDIDITDSKDKEDIINKLKWRNNISNLPNREKLVEDLDILFQKSNMVRYVILINIDLFSRINFSYGYKYGDSFILEIANYLTNSNKNISVYHLGGAEFGIITDSESLTNEMIDIILKRFKKPWIIDSLEQYCTVSIGISKFPSDGTDAEVIIKNATSALKRAKLDSKGKVFYFDTESDGNLVRRLQVEYFLRLAVMQNKDSFKVFYQPIVDTKTGKIVSAEALVRWIDEELGFINPDEFIYLAEELGIINIIDNHVLEIACKTIKNINKKFNKNISISVNLSPVQFYEENAHIIIKDIIDKIGIDYEYINLEITETTAVSDLANTKRKLNELRSLGIKISLDDFGTGYSSLNTLQNMPINTLKIDKHFIKNMKKSNYNYVFIKTIVELAHSANIRVCCEGIETLEEWNELKKLNTDVLQGYLFGKPLPENEFIDFIKNSI